MNKPASASAPAQALEAAALARPDDPAVWRALSDARRVDGDLTGADAAQAQELRASARDPLLRRAAEALCEQRLSDSHQLTRQVLAQKPDDPAALRLLAEIALRMGRDADAEPLLARCVVLTPAASGARYAYAMALHRQGKVQASLAQAEVLLKGDPKHPIYRHLKAAALNTLGANEAAAEVYAGVVADYPDAPLSWVAYGHVLKTVGRQSEAVEAYRRALALRPGLGEAWWSLSNLKTVRFGEADVQAMAAELAGADLAGEDPMLLNFALGKALEDAGDYSGAFEAYAAANAHHRRHTLYDAEANSLQMRRSKALLSASFFAARKGWGAPDPDPIFIVGLPRSGSTLVEQILASHSEVEGTQELPDLISIATRLGGPARNESESAYPEILAALSPAECAELGREYLERTSGYRALKRRFFIDKMPNNFAHVGLIQLILPNARIIDARRHPLGCCFSGFKQHFAVGQGFTYDLGDIGHYYRDYVELMAHFDAVLPGRVCRVIYEALVADPETQVRALLDHCGLPFEEGCLRFYENERAVRTASSEQVRRPIFTEGMDHWRNFEPWLDPLKAALGPVLDAYPGVPAF
jgi:predicted Zn-dependent protease